MVEEHGGQLVSVVEHVASCFRRERLISMARDYQPIALRNDVYIALSLLREEMIDRSKYGKVSYSKVVSRLLTTYKEAHR